MSVIVNVARVVLLIAITDASGSASRIALLFNTQSADRVKVKDTSQLINGIASVPQKLFIIC